MKKIFRFIMILTAILVLVPASAAYAKQAHPVKQNQKQVEKQSNKKVENQKQQQTQAKPNAKIKEKKQTFKINGSPVIKYGKYKLPISPVTKGMGAAVAFDKNTGVITVTKSDIKVVIDLKNKTASVNGVADTTSGIFTAKNDKKMTVLIQYIAKALGIKASVDDDDVIVTVPGLDAPASVTVTAVGGTVVANTLNTTNTNLTASATIVAGQAAGGKAELYVGTKLVATDSSIAAADTTVTFTTSDETPVNAELQAAVPGSGVVTVKLYNAANSSVTSSVANPTLTVDYAAPTVAAVSGAALSVSGSSITLATTGASSVGDKVDVSKITLYNADFSRAYQLTNAAGTGSSGIVASENSIQITLSSTDLQGLTNLGSTINSLSIAPGSLLIDAAGNVSLQTSTALYLPVAVLN